MKYGEKASVSPSPVYRSSRRARQEASILLSAVGSSQDSMDVVSVMGFSVALMLKNLFTVRSRMNLLRSLNKVKGFGPAEGAKLRPLLSSDVSSRLRVSEDKL